MSPIGLGVIGAGYWGPNLVRTAVATPAFRLHWLCDLDEDRARTVLGRYTTVQATARYEECSPTRTSPRSRSPRRPPPTSRSSRGAARPASTSWSRSRSPSTAADAREAGRAGRAVRPDPDVRPHLLLHAGRAAGSGSSSASGELGELQFVDSVRINLGLVQPDVDVLWDLAPHDLSILDFVLPDGVDPVAVAAHGARPASAPAGPASAYLTLRLSTGALAHVHVNWLSPTKIRTTVVRRLAAHARLGRPEPAAAAQHLRPGRRPGSSRSPDSAERAAGADLLPARRHGRPGAAGTRGAAAVMVDEFAAAITRAAARR